MFMGLSLKSKGQGQKTKVKVKRQTFHFLERKRNKKNFNNQPPNPHSWGINPTACAPTLGAVEGRKGDSMKETDKTYQLLQLLDRYGIMTRTQIIDRLSITEKNLRLALKKLEKLGFIKTFKETAKYAHYITTKGSEYIGLLNFGYVQGDKQPNLATLRHNLMMNDAIAESIQLLRKTYPDNELMIVTEREILAEKYLDLNQQYRGKWLRREKAVVRHKIPDFYLLITIDDEILRISYELELTRKSRHALETKLKWYADQKKNGWITQVCYVYDDERISDYVAINASRLNLSIQFYKMGSIHTRSEGNLREK